MKVSEAEKLVCPFMAQMGEDGSGFTVFSKHSECITTNCMAWKATDTIDIYTRHRYDDFATPEDMLINYRISKTHKFIRAEYNESKVTYYTKNISLEPQDCEGYCQRIGQ